MIVYSSSIWLENSTPLLDVFSTITFWFHTKTKATILPQTFLDTPYRKFRDGSYLEILKTDNSYPIVYSLRYTQRDKEISGRTWITEIGIKKDNCESDIQCSFLVQTSETSIAVPPPQQITRPWLIRELLSRCVPSRSTIGLSVKTIENKDDAKAFSYEINLLERKFPIILVSPTAKGDYLLNSERLLLQTSGLAEIVLIAPTMDTFLVSSILGKENSAYHGAINILFPQISRKGENITPTKLIIPGEIAQLINDDGIKKGFEDEIMSIVCHRMNLPNSWVHISREIVKEALRKRELEKFEKYASESGELKQYLNLLQEDNLQKQLEISELRKSIENIQNENEFYVNEFDNADSENKNLQIKVEGLSSQLEDLTNSKQLKRNLADCSEELRDILFDFVQGTITPYQSLDFISRVFPDRIVVLESAFKSAENSEDFFEKRVVFTWLWKLATEYWNLLFEGKGDTEARRIFGNDYAAKESETIENKKKAIKRRTFIYNGQEIEMQKHLKHGRKDSKSQTIRVHFAWQCDEKRIIIGYCGPHIENF